MRITRGVVSIIALLVVAASAFAQDRKALTPDDESQYVVSAKAGGVNIVEGNAFFKRGKSDWDLLIAGDELRPGDSVRTEADGRVEILLSPGSFLRLAENSEFIFSSTSIYNLKLKIVKGSAIVEASAVDSSLEVTAGQSRFSIVQNGIYRFSVDADGKSQALVRKGRILFDDRVVKDGKKIEIASGAPPLIADFDKKAQDSFDIWSKSRAETIIAANRKLSDRTMKRSLSSRVASNLWLYDPFFGGFTFLPYGSGFNSPYGFGYRRSNPYCDWRNGYAGNSGHSGSYGNSGNGSLGGNSGGSSGGNTSGGSRGGGAVGGGGGSTAPSHPTPSGNSGADRPTRSGPESGGGRGRIN